MVDYLPRSAWGARPARGTALVASKVLGEAIHWPGMTKPIDAAGDIGKRRVASALRGWQNFHMDVRGWADIAYQIAVDQAGRAWTLRGNNIRSGANGDATVNGQYGAILLILAPGEQPSAAMKATVRGVVADFRRWFPKGTAIRPHSAVRPAGTTCPGPLAQAAIKRGDFTPGAATPPTPTPPPPKDDDMAGMSLDEFKGYLNLFYSEGGTGAVYHKHDRDAAAAQLAATKEQTAAINAASDAQVAAIDRVAQAIAGALPPKV